MSFKETILKKYQTLIIAAPMTPVKTVKKDGTVIEVYERDNFTGLLWANLSYNGGIYMPSVQVKIFEKGGQKAIIHKSVSMSKKEYKDFGLSKKSTPEEKNPKYIMYVDEHKTKYRNQMTNLFSEAQRELEALKKHTVEPGVALSPHMLEEIKAFIYNPNQHHTTNLLMDMKDKGYLRPMLRGRFKGLLMTDMKAINRVVLDRELSVSTTAISALIAKDLADKLKKWTHWGYSSGLISDIHHWAKHVAEQYNFSEEEKRDFQNKTHEAVKYYSKGIHQLVMAFNQKIKDAPSTEKPSESEEEEEIIQPSE